MYYSLTFLDRRGLHMNDAISPNAIVFACVFVPDHQRNAFNESLSTGITLLTQQEGTTISHASGSLEMGRELVTATGATYELLGTHHELLRLQHNLKNLGIKDFQFLLE